LSRTRLSCNTRSRLGVATDSQTAFTKEDSPKNLSYEQVARLGKALASPKRLKLLELLAQGEKSAETLVAQAGIDMRLASAHFKA